MNDATEINSPGTWRLRVGTRTVSLGRSGTLLVSRAFEQMVLGLGGILVAWRVGVHQFAPISALLVINSFSVVCSDFGLGTALMGADATSLSRQSVSKVRRLNLVLIPPALLFASLLGGTVSIIVALSVLLWGSSGEAYIRKAALLRLDLARRSAICEVGGTLVFAAAIVIGLRFPSTALLTIGCGLIIKHITESALARGWSAAFGPDGVSSWNASIWLTGILAFAINNVDFVIVGLLISSKAFAIYSLGFRVAAAVVSQISYVVDRIALVDFGKSFRSGHLSAAYKHRRRQLFQIGLASSIATLLISPFLVRWLGPAWHPALGVIVTLTIAVPWRICGGLGQVCAVAVGQAPRLARWEFSRLFIAAAVMFVAAFFGLNVFAIAVSLIAIYTTVGYDRLGSRYAGLKQTSWVALSSPLAILLLVLSTWAFR